MRDHRDRYPSGVADVRRAGADDDGTIRRATTPSPRHLVRETIAAHNCGGALHELQYRARGGCARVSALYKALVFTGRLKEFASLAQQHESAGETESAIEQWNAALLLLAEKAAQNELFAGASRSLSRESGEARREAGEIGECAGVASGFRGVGAVLLLSLGSSSSCCSA